MSRDRRAGAEIEQGLSAQARGRRADVVIATEPAQGRRPAGLKEAILTDMDVGAADEGSMYESGAGVFGDRTAPGADRAKR